MNDGDGDELIPVDTDSDFGRIVAGLTPATTAGPISRAFWVIIAWLFVLALWVAAILAVVATFWALWLAARALFRAMGLG